MIPKIAYFHWDGDGPAMNWLRYVSIATFAKFNPTWEIRLIRSRPQDRNSDLIYMQRADMAWWEALRNGGFVVATDIVFLKPVPEDWLDAELCACTNDAARVFQFAMLGATPGHKFIEKAIEKGEQRIREVGAAMDFQDLGVWLLRDVAEHMGEVKELPMSALCHYDQHTCWKLWEIGHRIELPPEAIGVHWYGGDELTRRNEWLTAPGSEWPIVRLAETVFP